MGRNLPHAGGWRPVCLLALLITAWPAFAQTLGPQTGELASGAARQHPVQLAAGDYVTGRLTGHRMRLVLLDASGHRLRVLAHGPDEEKEYRFIAPASGPHALEVRAPQAGRYTLTVEHHIPLEAQRLPEVMPPSPRLQAWLASPQPLATEAFWRELALTGTPLIESQGVTPPLAPNERLMTFLWRSAAHGVRLLGGPSSDHDALHQLGETDIWWRSYRVPDSTRLSYQLAPDVPRLALSANEQRRAILATAQQDPLNPRTLPDHPLDRFDAASLVELTGAPKSPWTSRRPEVASGQLQTKRLASRHLGNERDIHIYRSAGYRNGAKGQALVVLFDAERYLKHIPLPTILDNLVAEQRLPPLAAIFVANPSRDTRAKELPPTPAMASFMADELMPWAHQMGLQAKPAQTLIAGASYGGLAAAWVALKHPEHFGLVYSQSGSFWWSPSAGADAEPEWLTRELANTPRQAVHFHLEAGLFETGRAGVPGILEASRHLRDVLTAKGYAPSYREYAAGHDNAHWRTSIGPALIELLRPR
jgi:enterochelin esterase family protein